MGFKIGVVIPCFRCKAQIFRVLERIGPTVVAIYVVDDFCPEGTGLAVEKQFTDPRLKVLYHKLNQGVGGAVMTGYRAALEDKMDIVVKVDGDGQMDPELIPLFTRPIERGYADYTKGNRFHAIEGLEQMPPVRIFGNAILSFMTKVSSGYWEIFDPTNGYTAIHHHVLRELPLQKIHKRYFFESDMLFRLNLVKAVVKEVPMTSHYSDERSNLKILKIIPDFLKCHFSNAFKRVIYSYFLRNFSLASLELVVGIIFIIFGATYGSIKWAQALDTHIRASSGEVMLSSLPIIIGFQLILNFLSYDMNSTPKTRRAAECDE